jgi:hypothetical protein
MTFYDWIAYRFINPSIIFFDEELKTARVKSDPVEMLQMRKADAQVHAGLSELRSSVLQTLQRR